MPRAAAQETMNQWNASVDEYIALGTDERDTYQIERVSKIDIDNAPLHKYCESLGCRTGLDTPAGVQMKRCGGCKLVRTTCDRFHQNPAQSSKPILA